MLNLEKHNGLTRLLFVTIASVANSGSAAGQPSAPQLEGPAASWLAGPDKREKRKAATEPCKALLPNGRCSQSRLLHCSVVEFLAQF